MVSRSGDFIRRAGRYVRQPAGYSAFIPSPLPPDPPLDTSGEVQAALSQADLALGRLDGSVQTLPDPDVFVLMYVRKEAVLSSRIEGTQSTVQDVLAAEARFRHPTTPSDVNEVINYVNAMNHGLERLRDLPVSVRLIREIHQRLLHNVRGSDLTPGELRTSQNWIGSADCTLNEATFVPPPPHLVPEALGDLELFLHTGDDLPMLLKVGLAHAQFEAIHPFLDGNGRTGRLLITFLLTERDILRQPVLYLSHYFERHRQEYYDRLLAVTNKGDWEGWMLFFLRGVAEVSAEAAATVRRILLLREDHRRTIAETFGGAAGNRHIVLEHLYERPLVSVNEVSRLTGTSYAAANQLVARMADSRILREITGRVRSRIFAYQSYIDLFDENGPEPEEPQLPSQTGQVRLFS